MAADTIRQHIADFRFVWDNKPYSVGASIGIALVGDKPVDFDTVLSQADMACRMAKELGRNRIHAYTEDDEGLTRRHGEMRWVSRLQQALEHDQFFLECQRIVPTDPAKSEYFWEILVRINDDGRTIYPNAFIPSAERYGLMPQIDRWVVRNALTFLGELQQQVTIEAKQITLFINISGMSIGDPEFLSYVKETLQATRVDPRNVCFEVTETATIANFAVATEFIENINKLGCRTALDDFGSGLCSFNYLKNLPVSFIKIDGTFIRGMLDDKMDRVIVDVIKQISDAAALFTIAEFVADKAVLKALAEIGVDYAQGFGIARPQAISTLINELATLDDAANDS
jgi:Amt family ammonium transporter